MTSIRRAIVYSSATRYSMTFLGLLSSMAIARLLTPEEIGTFAIASAIVMIMSEFRILGAGSYLIREKELTNEKISSAMGLTMLISWSMGGGIWLISQPAAAFYELAPIESIFKILSVSFFLAPMISIPTALMTRELKFKDIFIIKIIRSISNVVFTIALILMDFSFYALAWGYTMAVVIEFLAVLALCPKNMIWRPSLSNFREIAAFGIFTSMANIFTRALVILPDMIIGKLGTPVQVGMFSRGLGFIEFVSKSFLRGVQPVVLPYLAGVKRTGGDTNKAYIQASVMLGSLILPVLSVASVVSLPAIFLFFGDQWLAAAPYASLVAFWAMFRTMHWFSSDLMIARGGEKLFALKEGLACAALFVSIVTAFPFGLNAVAVAFVLTGAADFLFTTWILKRFIGLNALDYLLAWRGVAVLTALCGISAYAIKKIILMLGFTPLWGLAAVAIILPGVWLVGLKVTGQPLWQEVRRLF